MDKSDKTNKTLQINPVTRLEGHAKITLQLDAKGKVAQARFHVNEFRGFEKFCEGRPFMEMPSITPRICGICPVSHAVASAKAGEALMRIRPTPAGDMVRKLMHLGQIVSSHALSFFYLSSPDMLLGWDSDTAKRNVVGLAEAFPELALRGIKLRKFSQRISELITGKRVHAMGIVAGGMAAGLSPQNRDALLAEVPASLETARLGLELFARYARDHASEVENFDACETLYLGTVTPEGAHEFYDGKLRFVDAQGKILQDQIDPARYLEFITERSVEWSYLKYPYYKPLGFEAGVYRVGPLARLNIAEKMQTPLAQKEFIAFKALGKGRPVHQTFLYHQARLIELLSALEQIQGLLEHPLIVSEDLRAFGGRNQQEGVGCSESPRGTLFHHYAVDKAGLLTRVNLLIATGQNNPSMNRSVLEIARRLIAGPDVSEGIFNRIEGAVRCYDPCLSCSTHALGAMPMILELYDAGGRLACRLRRDA